MTRSIPLDASHSELMTLGEIKENYGSALDGAPSVYCGTYRKYNEGSLFGAWLDLTKFSDYDDFISVCKQLHADEDDPELMFQDYDGFPSSLYCESCFSEDYFDKIIEYADLDSDEREALEDFIDLGNDFDMSLFRECYCGKFDSETDFAEEIVNSCYDLERLMGDLSRYFNYEAFADELFAYDYAMGDNGYVFRR